MRRRCRRAASGSSLRSPSCSAPSMSRPRKPVQSMKKSPSTIWPLCSSSDATTAIRVRAHLLDLALDALHALGFAELAQVTRVQRGIEVIGVVDARFLAQRELALHGSKPLETILAQRHLRTARRAVQPEVVEFGDNWPAGRNRPKGCRYWSPMRAQFSNQMATLKVAAHSRMKCCSLMPSKLVKRDDGRHRGFTDPDGADFLRLHQRDVEQLAEMRRQRHGRHPAGGTTTGNNDLPDRTWCGQCIDVHPRPLQPRRRGYGRRK